LSRKTPRWETPRAATPRARVRATTLGTGWTGTTGSCRLPRRQAIPPGSAGLLRAFSCFHRPRIARAAESEIDNGDVEIQTVIGSALHSQALKASTSGKTLRCVDLGLRRRRPRIKLPDSSRAPDDPGRPLGPVTGGCPGLCPCAPAVVDRRCCEVRGRDGAWPQATGWARCRATGVADRDLHTHLPVRRRECGRRTLF